MAAKKESDLLDLFISKSFYDTLRDRTEISSLLAFLCRFPIIKQSSTETEFRFSGVILLLGLITCGYAGLGGQSCIQNTG